MPRRKEERHQRLLREGGEAGNRISLPGEEGRLYHPGEWRIAVKKIASFRVSRLKIQYDIVMTMVPLVIPRKEHGISRKQVSPNALRTLYRFRSRGFIAYLVGGCVRDLLLGRPPKDFDIATNATPSQIRRLFSNCRLIGRRFRLAHLHFDDEILEVSTFRRTAVPSDQPAVEGAESDQHLPRYVKDDDGMIIRDNLFGTPEEDALCRDFTINALAYSIADFSVIDYSSGFSDLRQRLIRPIGDSQVRFSEDPVRMLRAVRFAASHDFTIEPSAWKSICELAPAIARVSPARLYEEVQKIVLFGSARPALDLLGQSGLLAALLPRLDRWLAGDGDRMAILRGYLDAMDGLRRSGEGPSLGLVLAAIFGPGVEEEALALHREGIPHQQALDGACTMCMKEICQTVTVPGRTGSHMRAILALQPALHRNPPQRPATRVSRPEFGDALHYLRLAARTKTELQPFAEWWNAFLAGSTPLPPIPADPSSPGSGRKKRRRRRGKKRPVT